MKKKCYIVFLVKPEFIAQVEEFETIDEAVEFAKPHVENGIKAEIKKVIFKIDEGDDKNENND